MKWQGREVSFGFRETRSTGGYTDQLTRLLVHQVSTVTETDPLRTASVETAAGIWGRSFASVKVEPDTAAAVLTPSIMNLIGRELIRTGEILFRVSVTDGKRMLTPASHWDVQGNPEPSTWRFKVQLAGPDSETDVMLTWPEVVFLRWATNAVRRWEGLSPLQVADATGALSGSLERSLANEAKTPHGFLLPVPAADEVTEDETDPLADMKKDLAGLDGGLSVVETTHHGWGEGRGAAPQKDWMPNRLGPSPPQALCTLREDVHRTILSACGISPAMTGGRSDGTARREAYRTFAHMSLAPVGRIVAAELAAKLDIPNLRFDWSGLMAGDITGKARAFKSLVGGGMAVEEAASLSGLLSDG